MWQCLMWEEETQSALQTLLYILFYFKDAIKTHILGLKPFLSVLWQCGNEWMFVLLSRLVPPQMHQQSGVHN